MTTEIRMAVMNNVGSDGERKSAFLDRGLAKIDDVRFPELKSVCINGDWFVPVPAEHTGFLREIEQEWEALG